MWDTSQTGLSYLFTMFENIFPAQGVTEGDYNNAAAGETKPTNSIIVTTEDYKSVFQFAYCTFEHTTLAWIDANTGSEENAIYYSDLSKFNDSNILVWPYFSSSGKGTYNVGYKADDLAEVALFMAGNGVVNPGDTSGEATNWLQVTTRIGYNNPTPVLQDADGSTSALIYLTPDLIYQNASGTLRHVEAATEETTKGQSITYYKITPSGLNAYKVFSPIGLLRVEDGDTGKFKMVKFNLGAKEDLMVPFVHNFIRDLSHAKVSQLFLAGAHASIYIAHYEVIESSGFGGLFMIILIIVIVVIAWQVAPSLFGSLQAGAAAGANTAATMTINGVVTPITLTKVGGATTATLIGGGAVPAGIATTVAPLTGIVSTAAISAGGAVGAFSIAWGQTLFNMAINFAVNQIVKTAVTAVAGDNPKLAAVLGIAAAVGMNTVGFSGGKVSFKMPDFKDIFKIFANAASNISVVVEVYVENETKELEKEYDLFRKDLTTRENFLKEIYEGLLLKPNGDALSLLEVSLITTHNPILAEDYNTIYDSQFDSPYIGYDQESTVFDPAISVNTFT